MNIAPDQPLLAVQGTNTKVLLQSYIDSGAARSVCPRAHGKQFGLVETEASRRQDGFRTATGRRVRNLGSRTVAGKDEHGGVSSMNYAVADVAVALDSVSQICDKGATVIFRKTDGCIVDATGREHPFERHGDTYVRRLWVERKPAFTRPV